MFFDNRSGKRIADVVRRLERSRRDEGRYQRRRRSVSPSAGRIADAAQLHLGGLILSAGQRKLLTIVSMQSSGSVSLAPTGGSGEVLVSLDKAGLYLLTYTVPYHALPGNRLETFVALGPTGTQLFPTANESTALGGGADQAGVANVELTISRTVLYRSKDGVEELGLWVRHETGSNSIFLGFSSFVVYRLGDYVAS